MAPEWEGLWDDYYKVLGLNGGCEAYAVIATADQLRRAYMTTKGYYSRRIADAVAGDNKHAAALKLERVEWAYDVLSDPSLRQNYDACYKEMVRKLKLIAFQKKIDADYLHDTLRTCRTEMEDEEAERKRKARRIEELEVERRVKAKSKQEAEDLGLLVVRLMKV